ncbi:Tyrosyl-tRNA synthetase [Hordeum vulgare]|nr:Tyrosyl-tRNA synthetase [Hordeum vulgare]
MTKIQGFEHEDGTTRMSKPRQLQDIPPRSDFTAIPICGIEYAESATTLFEDKPTTNMTTESLKEYALEASDKVAIKDDASIFGGDTDDVPSLAFINGYGDDMVERGIFPSTTTMFGDELRDFDQHIETEITFTTRPIYDEFPQFQCEEIQDPHHLSEMSDSTICLLLWF